MQRMIKMGLPLWKQIKIVPTQIKKYIGMHIGYWWESQKVRDHGKDQDVGEWTILKWILER
jgi:hypothetical protein